MTAAKTARGASRVEIATLNNSQGTAATRLWPMWAGRGQKIGPVMINSGPYSSAMRRTAFSNCRHLPALSDLSWGTALESK
jgi:hypothetical protein